MLASLRRAAAALLLALTALPGAAAALDLKLELRDGDDGPARLLSLADLDALPQARIKTSTPWTIGVVVFDGVSGPAIAAMAPKGATEVHAVAHNDYVYTIPLEDFATGEAIIATRRDGATMTLRNKGPYWVMYDFDGMTRGAQTLREPRAVWQLKTLVFR